MNPLSRFFSYLGIPGAKTVRNHRAPSQRFKTLESFAATRGRTLVRDGRNYILIMEDSREFFFSSLSRVKAFLDLTTDAEASGASHRSLVNPVTPTNDRIRE